MFRRIAVGLDGSDASKRAFETALHLASQSSREVWVVSVEERLPHYAASVGEVEEAKREMDTYFQKVHEEARAGATAANVKLHSVILAGHAATTILRLAREQGFDLIVLGGGAAGIGGTADRVVEDAPCSVLIVRETPLSNRVEEVMTRDVVTVEPNTPVREVVELLIRRGVKAVPVVNDHGRPIGMITGGDLLERGGLSHRISLVTVLDAETVSGQLQEVAKSGLTAQDVMTPDPQTVSSSVSVSAAARLMAERRFKRLPVVDEEGRLVGLVARLDILRTAAHMVAEPPLAAPGVLGGGRLVREFMATSIPAVPPETSAKDVLARLSASPFRRVVVVDSERKILGMITDREVIQHLGPKSHPSLLRLLAGRPARAEEVTFEGRAADMMLNEVVVVSGDAPILEALRLMIDRYVKRLPVVNGDGRLMGIVDRDAVLRAVAGEF